MAGKYFYSSPLGPTMSNLSEAIGGLPEREMKAGLMGQQALLAEARARSEAAQAEHYGAQTADINDQRAGREAYAQAMEQWGNTFGSGGATSGGMPAAVVPPTVAPSGPVPSAAVAGVGMVPGAAPVPPVPPPGQAIDASPMGGGPGGGLSDALGVGAPAAAVPPVTQPVAPAMPADTGTGRPSLAATIAPVIEQFKQLPPKTQQQVFNTMMGNSIRAGHQYMKNAPEFNLGVAAGNRAQAPDSALPFNDRQMSDWQLGAGSSQANTMVGGRETIKQKADEAAAKDATKRYEIGVESGDRRRGQDLTNERGVAKANGANAKPLTPSEWGLVRKAFKESRGPGMEASGQQMEAMEKRFMELRGQGVGKADAVQQVTEEAWGDVETSGEGKGWFGTNIMKPDDKVERKFQLRTPKPIDAATYQALQAGDNPAAAAAAPTAGKPAAAAKPADLIPKDKKGQVDVSALRGQAEQAIAAGKDRKAVEAAFKKATGMFL